MINVRKYIGLTIVVLAAVLFTVAVLADSFSSAGSGNWKNGPTWGGTKKSETPGGKRNRTDDATVNNGHTINHQGKLTGKLNNVTVNGGVQGVGNATNIKIDAGGNVTIGSTGKVGGSASGAPKNPVNITAKGSVTVNGSVTGNGKPGQVNISGKTGVTVGGGGKVESKGSGVNVTSSSGSVRVDKGGEVKGKGNVEINSGKGKTTSIYGKVTSTGKNVIVNGANKKKPGNVRVGPNGVIEAEKEVVIYAETLYVEGKIKGNTVQKHCKKVILKHPPGSITSVKKLTNKIDTLLVVDKSDPSVPAEESEDNKIIGEDGCHIDMSAAPLAVSALNTAMVATGPGGTIDMTGNPPGTYVIECAGPIEIYSDNLLLDAGVMPMDICGPGPVTWGPPIPVIAVNDYCWRDTVGVTGYPGEVQFNVTNAGLVAEDFDIAVTDTDGWPYTVSDINVWLDHVGDRDTTVTISFDVPPWAIPDVDTNSFTLTATSTTDPTEFYTESVTVEVIDECDLRDVIVVWDDTENTAPGDTADVYVEIRNTGTVFPDVYDVLTGDTQGWMILAPPPPPPLALDVDQDSLYHVRVVIPLSAVPGVVNELFFDVLSTTCPGVAAADTVVLTVTDPTAVEGGMPVYREIRHSSYPNPFNPAVTISFTVPDGEGQARVEVFDVNGRRVKTLFEGKLGVGPHTREWDGTNQNGDNVTSGVYLYRITVGDRTVSGKMVLTK
jgi:hypothetical protein